MNNWIKILNEKSIESKTLKESDILINIPIEFIEKWDNFMRGRTCPILDNGEYGVYSWDLQQFLNNTWLMCFND
jgi:hypothetical protein